jgi:hypothetical protein
VWFQNEKNSISFEHKLSVNNPSCSLCQTTQLVHNLPCYPFHFLYEEVGKGRKVKTVRDSERSSDVGSKKRGSGTVATFVFCYHET